MIVLMTFVALAATLLLLRRVLLRRWKRYEEGCAYAFGRRLITSLHEHGRHDDAYVLYQEIRLNLSYLSYSLSRVEERGVIDAYDQLYPAHEGAYNV